MLLWSHAFVALVCLFVVFPPVGGAPDTSSCHCPQTTRGWMIFDDASRNVPDFIYEESVTVQRISVCSHGIHLYFIADEEGEPRYISFIFVKPTLELYKTRVMVRPGDPPREVMYERALAKYERVVKELQLFLGFNPVDVDFRGLGTEMPTITPAPPLHLHWKGKSLKLTGYVDVYMTVFA